MAIEALDSCFAAERGVVSMELRCLFHVVGISLARLALVLKLVERNRSVPNLPLCMLYRLPKVTNCRSDGFTKGYSRRVDAYPSSARGIRLDRRNRVIRNLRHVSYPAGYAW